MNSVLDDTALKQLREHAHRCAGPFVDPRLLRRVTSMKMPRAWASRVIGRDFTGLRSVSWPEIVLLAAAYDADHGHVQWLLGEEQDRACEQRQFDQQEAAACPPPARRGTSRRR